MRKLHRKMFERQMAINEERLLYLREVKAKGGFEGVAVVVGPSVVSGNDEMNAGDGSGKGLSLSLVILPKDQYPIMERYTDNKQEHKLLTQYQKDTRSNATIPIPPSIQHLLPTPPFYTPTLNPSLPPTIYRISHSSELVFVGQRTHWLFVKDASSTHTLYAMQAVWDNERPITEAVLRRSSEFLPGAGAVHVRLRKTKGGAFNLRMQNLSTGDVLETPDRGEHTKDWSPRRFEYGGRKFVWKNSGGDSVLMRSFKWEELYETSKVWKKEGSRTGKMEDEVVGQRLCWGEKNGGMKTDHTLYFAAGLDQFFREHLLASQLARLIRCSYPPNKDTERIEAGAAGVGMFALVLELTQ